MTLPEEECAFYFAAMATAHAGARVRSLPSGSPTSWTPTPRSASSAGRRRPRHQAGAGRAVDAARDRGGARRDPAGIRRRPKFERASKRAG